MTAAVNTMVIVIGLLSIYAHESRRLVFPAFLTLGAAHVLPKRCRAVPRPQPPPRPANTPATAARAQMAQALYSLLGK
ncbi:MAG TPA: hypothetical protein DD735_06375 [Clostridiales bacterium]|nr:hypothetical protein [Clostridiales bacterium]